MRRTKILLLLLTMASITCQAQYKGTPATTTVTKINFLSPGVSYEFPVGKHQTVFGYAFLSPSIALDYSGTFGASERFALDPGLTAQYRYYYNYQTRTDKGKRTDMNSANYVAAVYRILNTRDAISGDFGMEDNRRPIQTLGAVWGLQRNYMGRFSLDLNVGLGYSWGTTGLGYNGSTPITMQQQRMGIISDLTLGLWINRRQ